VSSTVDLWSRAESIERIVQPFRRLRRDRISSRGGVGLGLSIVQAVTSAHRGELVVRARADGGLAVAVRLPARVGEREPIAGAGLRPEPAG
jgi:signal transduction histidine kinase